MCKNNCSNIEYNQLKQDAIELRKAQNALAKCKEPYLRRQLAIDVVKKQNEFDKLIGLK